VAQTLLHACWQEHRDLPSFNDLWALKFVNGALLNDPNALLREQGAKTVAHGAGSSFARLPM
jgi:hypothetical protein